MRIDKITIKNFKGFADESFHLNPRFTVFIGDNAKGKTSVLEAIAIAAGSFLRGLDIPLYNPRKIEKHEIRISTINGLPQPQLPVEITAFGEVNGKTMENGWKRIIRKTIEDKNKAFSKAKNILNEAAAMHAQNRREGGVTFPVIAYHGTGRLWAENEEVAYKKQEEGVAMAYKNCLSPKSSGKDFLSWYKTYEDEIRKFDQDEDKLLLATMKKCIMSMIPDGHWQEMAFSFKENDLAGVFESPEGKKEKLFFGQLSDGYRNMIGMVADIAYRCIQLNPHLGENAVKDTPGIVLIDEIDLHLHPKWQRRVVNDLKNAFPKIQFVATTHSPFIVQSLEKEELVNLNGEDGIFPKDCSIDLISHSIMGVESNYGIENHRKEIESQDYLSLLAEAERSAIPLSYLSRLEEMENTVLDPAVRALLRMNRIAKNIIDI